MQGLVCRRRWQGLWAMGAKPSGSSSRGVLNGPAGQCLRSSGLDNWTTPENCSAKETLGRWCFHVFPMFSYYLLTMKSMKMIWRCRGFSAQLPNCHNYKIIANRAQWYAITIFRALFERALRSANVAKQLEWTCGTGLGLQQNHSLSSSTSASPCLPKFTTIATPDRDTPLVTIFLADHSAPHLDHQFIPLRSFHGITHRNIISWYFIFHDNSWYFTSTSNHHPTEIDPKSSERMPSVPRKAQLLATSRAPAAASGHRPRGCWTRAAVRTRGSAAGSGSKPSPPRALCRDNLRFMGGFEGF